MTGNTLSPQMRRFRLLAARRQTDPPPTAAVSPPAPLISNLALYLIKNRSNLD